MSLININLTTDWSVVSWWHTTSMDTKTNAPTDQQALAAPKDKPVGRRRLPPALRVQQILDNALLEFEEHGFQAARMETIAQRSGLSKGGLYAHFDSKEQLFEALLTRSIAMPDVKQMDLTPPVTVRQVAQWLVDQLYDAIAQPRAVTTMRLLISEGQRVPHLVQLWRERMVNPQMAMLGEVLRGCTAQQGAQRSVVAQAPWLAAAPAAYLLLSQLVLGNAQQPDLGHFKRIHVDMLCELLEPRPAPDTAAA